MSWLKSNLLYLAWLIALSAFFGSIYYGEVLNFEPCRLCWYQRIAMFPLVFLLGVAFYRNDAKFAKACLPLIVFGGLIAFYQSAVQLVPSLKLTALCGETACTLAGPAPYLSFIAFVLIGFLVSKNKENPISDKEI